MPSSRGSSQLRSPTLQVDFLPSEPPGKPMNSGVSHLSLLQGDLSYPGIKPRFPVLQADSLPVKLPGKPQNMLLFLNLLKKFLCMCFLLDCLM